MNQRYLISSLSALVVCIGIHSIFESAPHLTQSLLTTPSAHLASILTGSPILKTPEKTWLLTVTVGSPQVVTNACSGAGFTSLIIGLFIWQALTLRPSGTRFLITSLLIYPFAITTNACRIALSSLAAEVSERLFGPSTHDIVHMGLGTFVFLFAIIVFNLVLTYAYRSQRIRHTRQTVDITA